MPHSRKLLGHGQRCGSWVITRVQEIFAPLIEFVAGAATWVAENWSVLEPILLGLAAAVGVFAAMMAIKTAVTWLSVAANRALAVSLLQNPIMWIALIIGALIAMIYAWVQSVGGLKIAWLMAMNAIKTTWDKFVIGLITAGIAVMTFLINLQLAFLRVKNAVVGFILDMSVKVVEFLQDMVNGAIDIINKFIEKLNKIEGVNIQAIQQVTFAATFAAEVENKKDKMAKDYADQEQAANELIADMNLYLQDYKDNAATREQQRLDEIAAAQEDSGEDDGLETNPSELPEGGGEGGGGGGGGAVAANTGATAGNTAAMLDSIDLANEELKYLRELAEQEAINRFTTAEIKVEMQNDNYINSDTDIDGIVNLLSESLEEAMAAAAEGA